MKAKTNSIAYLETQYAYETAFHERILAESNPVERKRLYFEAYQYAYQQSRDLSPEAVDFGYQSQEIQILEPWLKQKDIIDYGCGYGSSTLHLAEYARTVTGYDILPDVIDVARQRLTQQNNVTFEVVEPADLPASAQSADIVYASDVIEHLHPEDASAFMEKAFQTLRPEGMLVCITPHYLYGPSDITRQFQPKGSQSKGFHLKEYGYGTLTTLMKEAGFKHFQTPGLSPRHIVKLPCYRQILPMLMFTSIFREKAEALSVVQRSRSLRKMWGLNRAVYILAKK
jgi:2-polyprenyl-3-methyl-5-hydroxy-6-metoxy-1,4-benzoquinol methylase